MTIRIDQDKCCGYGDCVLAAPTVFELGDDDVARVLVEEPNKDLADEVQEAIAACPVEAIREV